MDCLTCKKGSRVVDSKKTAQRITRRRECLGCGLRWNTTEYREGRAAKPSKPAGSTKQEPVRTKPVKKRSREELFDMREAGYDSDLDDIINDLGAWDDR